MYHKIIYVDKDKDGVKYQHPERSCKNCNNYPCFPEIDTFSTDFAKYGCRKYEDKCQR